MLVFYDRPDSAGVKLSDYQCVSVLQPENLKVLFPACSDIYYLFIYFIIWFVTLIRSFRKVRRGHVSLMPGLHDCTEQFLA